MSSAGSAADLRQPSAGGYDAHVGSLGLDEFYSVGPMEDDVVGKVPRYAMPNVSSLLPNYANSEQEFIHRTFHTGNYDQIRSLPNTLKEQQVQTARLARMEAARRFLMPSLEERQGEVGPRSNQQGLFQVFEYLPSRYSLADELASKERVESEAKRMTIGGKEFTPAGGVGLKLKHEDGFEAGKVYPYLGGPLEAMDELKLANRWMDDAHILEGPFVQSGTQKLDDKPTRLVAWDMMNNLRKWISQDWQGAEIVIYENEAELWVLKVVLASIDSAAGLLAYMNVFIRCNELVNAYRLNKVVEYWDIQPGDGATYYTLRPPWVRHDRLLTFFTLRPEERDWTTSHGVLEVNKNKPAQSDDD